MNKEPADHFPKPGMDRREFLVLTSMAAAWALTGCAANPVTGKRQLMLVSEDREIQMDKNNSPHQFSADYGPVRDRELSRYIRQIGTQMAAVTHRPHMPYRFECVNAVYVNAYAFPGGSIALTRGIVLELDDEAQLAALIGHELGHVNARHTAERMSKGMVTQSFISGLSAIVGTQGKLYSHLASKLGMLGAGALLASYSRDNEREADRLAMAYMVKREYNPQGLIGLMDMLKGLSEHNPGVIELMFSTHPMSDERYRNAVNEADLQYRSDQNLPVYRERFMDQTASLRALKGPIEEMEKGERATAQKKYVEAEGYYKKALKQAPDDYACLVMTAKCMIAQNKFDQARQFAEKAKAVYPAEAQAHHVCGFAKIKNKHYASAYEDFSAYEKRLPGNPATVFFKGLSLEGMGKKSAASVEYGRYLKAAPKGPYATHCFRRLKEWGYIKG